MTDSRLRIDEFTPSIQEILNKHVISPYQAASISGVHYMTINRWINKETEYANRQSVKKLAHSLGYFTVINGQKCEFVMLKSDRLDDIITKNIKKLPIELKEKIAKMVLDAIDN